MIKLWRCDILCFASLNNNWIYQFDAKICIITMMGICIKFVRDSASFAEIVEKLQP